MALLIGYLKSFSLEMGGADGQEYICNGEGRVIASMHVDLFYNY